MIEDDSLFKTNSSKQKFIPVFFVSKPPSLTHQQCDSVFTTMWQNISQVQRFWGFIDLIIAHVLATFMSLFLESNIPFYPTICLVYLHVKPRLALLSLPPPLWLFCLLPHPHVYYCQFRCKPCMKEWVCLGSVWGPSVTMGPLSVSLLIKFKQGLTDESLLYF